MGKMDWHILSQETRHNDMENYSRLLVDPEEDYEMQGTSGKY